MGSFLRLSRGFRPARATEVEPYDAFACVYDHAMDHVDYEAWAAYIDRLFERFGHGIRSVLEGGCGTGSLMKALHERGYRMAGFDRSLPMILAARGKVDGPLWQGDLRTAASLRRWDALLCLYDTIQYFDLDSLRTLFIRLAGLLKANGLFVFDAITEKHARTVWGNTTERDLWDGIDIFRHTRFVRRRRTLVTEFSFQHRSENRLLRERHVQFIHPLGAIVDSAAAGGFAVSGVFDEYTMNPGTEASDRVHFVLRKEVD